MELNQSPAQEQEGTGASPSPTLMPQTRDVSAFIKAGKKAEAKRKAAKTRWEKSIGMTARVNPDIKPSRYVGPEVEDIPGKKKKVAV